VSMPRSTPPGPTSSCPHTSSNDVGRMRSASGIASSTAFSLRARLGADSGCGSPFVCPSAASSNDRLVPGGGGGVFGRSAMRCVAEGGTGGDDVGFPLRCVEPGGLRAPGVKKLWAFPRFGVPCASCSRRKSRQPLSMCSLIRASLTAFEQMGQSTIGMSWMSGSAYATRSTVISGVPRRRYRHYLGMTADGGGARNTASRTWTCRCRLSLGLAMRSIATTAVRAVRTSTKQSTGCWLPASCTPRRAMSATTRRADPFKPAKRVAGQKQDVWYVQSSRVARRHV
jgi:hypothetical protein